MYWVGIFIFIIFPGNQTGGKLITLDPEERGPEINPTQMLFTGKPPRYV